MVIPLDPICPLRTLDKPTQAAILLAQQCRHAGAHAPRGFRLDTGGHHAAFRSGSAGVGATGAKYPANCSISASASRFTRARATGSKVRDGRREIRLDAGDLFLHLLAEARQGVVAEDVEPRHDVDQGPDVLDHRIAEHQRLALVVLAQPLADPLDRLAETPVQVADGIVQAFLDLVLDVALDAVGVVRGELGHEVVGVRDGRDAVADPELSCSASLDG